MIKELVLATHNQGKAREIAVLLEGYVERVVTAGELGLAEPEETELTFEGNALLKARAACLASGKVSLADDSGLAVNALGGDPGIYSARWGGPTKDFDLAMAKVHEALGDNGDRSAAFICALAIVWPDGREEVFEGRVEGDIVWPMRGGQGFGYDPVFQPTGHDLTFGEMPLEAKHDMSHRADAFGQLVDGVFQKVA